MAAAIHDRIILPEALSKVSEFIDTKPQAFLAGDEATQAAALKATKYVFDLSVQREKRARPPIAQLMRSIEPSTAPETRSQRKRKRSPSPPPKVDEEIWRPTPLESLHLEGMDDDQVWAQLELRAAALCETLKAVLDEDGGDEDDDSGEGMEMEVEEGMEYFDSDESEGSDDSEVEDEDDVEDEEGAIMEEITDLRDPSDENSEDEDELDLDRPTRRSRRIREGDDDADTGKRSGENSVLDDGFFSLADFNAETEEAEAMIVSKGHLGQDDDDDDDDAEDDVDLFAAVDEAGADVFDEDDLEEGGEPYYRDFFAPPSQKSLSGEKMKHKDGPPVKANSTSKVRFHDEVRVKKIKSRGKGNSIAAMKSGMMWEEDEEDDDDDDYDDGEFSEDDKISEGDEESDTEENDGGRNNRETIERLKDDLFAEDETPSQELSTYEARQAEIAAQIAELEAANVAPKEWALMGEATSRSRPVNSLLEEDLDFERVMKVVPVVTEERINSIEETIKKRILDNNFNDVVRKRPVDDKPFLPSRFFELNDQKSAQSLAQIYEDEYSTAVGNKVDDRDGKLKKEHEELEKMWDNICHKLDALSNAHFTPKQPKVTISTVSNLPTTTLESALPTSKSVTTMLAPEEIFTAPSDIRSRDELTPIEKRAHRNKQRKARKKAKDQLASTVDKFARKHKAMGSTGNVRKEKEKALKNVVKTGRGVTVVGKKSTQLKRKGAGQSIMPVDSKNLKL